MNNTPTVAPYLTGIAAKLQDPAVVHAAMLRGEIAKPAIRDMLRLYGGDALARWEAADSLLPRCFPSDLLKAISSYGMCCYVMGERGGIDNTGRSAARRELLRSIKSYVRATLFAHTAPGPAPVGHYSPEKLRAEAAAREVAP